MIFALLLTKEISVMDQVVNDKLIFWDSSHCFLKQAAAFAKQIPAYKNSKLLVCADARKSWKPQSFNGEIRPEG